jgi:hypothetical protein
MTMLSEPPNLSQIGWVPHEYFDQLPHSSAHLEDSETQALVDMDDNGSDTQELQPDDLA